MQTTMSPSTTLWSSSPGPSLFDLIHSLRQALHDELNSRRIPNGGKPLTVPLRDGHVESRSGQHARVRFRSASIATQGVVDDAQGEVIIDGSHYACLILGLSVDQLTLGIAATLQDYIPQAHLTIDRLRLLLALDKRLAAIEAHPQEYLTELALKCFSPHATPAPLPDQMQIVPDEPLNPAQLDALVRALTHDFLFLWGPPGTGKTKVIGALVRLALKNGHRTLICSNTNTAVDQTLDAVLGPLSAVTPGSIVRYGLTESEAPTRLAPFTVEALATPERTTLNARLVALQAEMAPLNEEITRVGALVALQQELDDLDRSRQTHTDEAHRLDRQIQQATLAKDAADAYLQAFVLERRTIRQASWFRRLFLRDLASVEADLEYAETVMVRHHTETELLQAEVADLRVRQTEHTTRRRFLQTTFARQLGDRPSRTLAESLTALQAHVVTLHQQITACQRAMSTVESRLIQRADVVATTLTRTYTASILDRERFDLVIIDEGSMASPPALFAACCLARRQVVIVGDFFQLPPIAEAQTAQAQQWMAQDIYRLAAIHDDQDPRVAALTTQYRMHPDIAELAARLYQRAGLSYLTDPRIRVERQPIVDLAPAPGKALVFVDTAPAHPWIDKDHKGSPRNRYHASVALTLARQALAADLSGQLRVSLIAPYRHQVRLLKDLAHEAHLTDRVHIGTIHGFQGQQSDVVIFDTTVTGDLTRTMLGRCDRGQSPCKLLNVAFTRAKSKLFVIGHRGAIGTLSRVPDSLLWECLTLTDSRSAVLPSTQFVAPFTSHGQAHALTPSGTVQPAIPRLYAIR